LDLSFNFLSDSCISILHNQIPYVTLFNFEEKLYKKEINFSEEDANNFIKKKKRKKQILNFNFENTIRS